MSGVDRALSLCASCACGESIGSVVLLHAAQMFATARTNACKTAICFGFVIRDLSSVFEVDLSRMQPVFGAGALRGIYGVLRSFGGAYASSAGRPG